MTLPLATLLGLADRPGAGHGLGPLDPALVRDLAAIAARSPHSQWCLTITDALRHLVQVRDGQCTFPPCSRHARESDFEHAIPYDQGGRTCACNGGARSRRCHRVKQSTGWTVTQPQPGWHQWTTPSGRTYTQGPMQYAA